MGAGLWGRNHVRNYAELGALAAVVDQREDVAAELAARHGAPARRYEDVLADPGIDGVVLALPPSLNHAFGMRALAAGKHLFVEKPMALTGRDAEALRGEAARRGLRLMVGHILQYHPAFAALRGLVADGRLGPLVSIVSSRLDLGRIRREEDALWALAPHDISMMLALAGAEPSRVAAFGGYHTDARIADAAAVELGFPDGLRGEIRVSWLNPFKEQRLVVIGRDAMAVFDDREPWATKLMLRQARVHETGGAPRLEAGEAEAVEVAPGEPLRLECRHFLDCIRTGAEPLTDGPEGLRVLAVLERASAALAANAGVGAAGAAGAAGPAGGSRAP